MAITAIAHALGASASGGSTSGTTASTNTTGGNFVAIVTGDFNAAGTGDTVSDSKGNTYTALTNYAGGFSNVTIWYCANATCGTGHTFTVAGSYVGFAVSVWASVKTSSPADAQNGHGDTFNTSIAAGSITPSENDELVITGLCDRGTAAAGTVSGYTVLDSVNITGGISMGVSHAYVIQTSAGATNPTWTKDFSGTDAAAAVASFKFDGGGGGGGGTPIFLPTLLAGLGAGGPFFRNPLG